MTALLAQGIDSPPVATLLFSLATAGVFLLAIDRDTSMRKTGIAILPVALLAVFVSLGGGAIGVVAALLAAAVADALATQHDPRANSLAFAARLGSRALLAGVFMLALATSAGTPGAWRIGACILVIAAAWWRIGRPHSTAASLRIAVAGAMAATAALSAPLAMLLGALLLFLCDMVDLQRSTGSQPDAQAGPLSDSLIAVRSFWLIGYVGHALIALSAVALLSGVP